MQQVYNLIGIAHKAGFISSGSEAVCTSMVNKRACLLVMSEDIAKNSLKSLLHCCIEQGIPCLKMGDRYQLGGSIGKAYRVALTVEDAGMASAILKAFQAAGSQVKSMGVDE